MRDSDSSDEDMPDLSAGLVVGIDLGTTYSVAAVFRDGRVEVVSNDGCRITPSFVCYHSDGSVHVGQQAKECRERDSTKLYDTKRCIGLRFSHESVLKHGKNWSFEVHQGEGSDNCVFKIPALNRSASPVEVAAHIIRHMLEAVQARFNQPVAHLVVTVPAYFDGQQKHATRMAVEMAGRMYGQNINLLSLVPEPFAATIAYIHSSPDESAINNVLVFDLGGGTFDTCLLDIRHTPNGFGPRVEAYGGNNNLGGRDVDNEMLDFLCAQDQRFGSIPAEQRHDKMQQLLAQVEKGKRAVNTGSTTRHAITLPHFFGDGEDYRHPITRGELDKIMKSTGFITKCTDEVSKLLVDPALDRHLTPADVSKVFLVGGSTRIIAIRNALIDMFGKDKVCFSEDPDEVVAIGACTYAAILTKRLTGMDVVDVVPRSLGLQLEEEKILIKYVPKGAQLPVKKISKHVYTLHDAQSNLVLPIIEGEDASAISPFNQCIGELRVPDLPNLPAGKVCIEVFFNIGLDGILHVHTRHPVTRKKIHVPVTFGGGIEKNIIMQAADEYTMQGDALVNDTKKIAALIYNHPRCSPDQESSALAHLEWLTDNARPNAMELRDVLDELKSTYAKVIVAEAAEAAEPEAAETAESAAVVAEVEVADRVEPQVEGVEGQEPPLKRAK